jgi:hypothetical protein
MQRVQWVDPSDDPNSSAVNSVGKSWNCDLLFQDSGCSGWRWFVEFVRRELEPDDMV